MAEESNQNLNGAVSGQPSPSVTSTPASSWLPSDIAKQYPSIEQKFKGKPFADFAKDYSEREKMIGRQAQEIGNLRKAASGQSLAPESADKYEFQFAEGQEVDEQTLGWFKGVAHENGLSQQQAATIAGQYAEAHQAQVAQWAEETNRQFSAADQEQGARALAAYTHGNVQHPLVQLLDQTGLGNNPHLMALLIEYGKSLKEDSFVDPEASSTVQTPNNAADRIREIRNTKGWDRNPELQAELHRLYPLAGANNGRVI